MVKKVFKVIGIVLATALGFVGGVVGVMAAMGKFKTPVVYPTQLEFAVTEETIIERIPYDTAKDWAEQNPTIYSFVLSGSNSSYDHEVNRRDCYITFKTTSGSKLITLCEKKGKPLIRDANNRYLVKCNEPIYYMVNKLDDYSEGVTDGKVVLEARSTNEDLRKPENPMTIWIDRSIQDVYVYGEGSVVGNTQTIDIGVDMSFDFKYSVDTPLSLKPISKESSKEIELYYNVEGMNYGTDFVRVTKTEIDKEDSPLHSILTYKDGVFSFKASAATPSVHEFYIAVFKTYEAKFEYEKSVEGLALEQPNYDRVTSVDKNNEANMIVTRLLVNVEAAEISKVGLDGTSIVLNLYRQNEKIYLDNEDEENNLGLYLKKGDNLNLVDASVRFNEFNFGKLDSGILVGETPVFTSRAGVELDEICTHSPGHSNLSNCENVKISNVELCDGYQIIEYITIGGVEYYCVNGAAVINGTDIKMVKPGKYVSFYLRNTALDEYKPADFTYDIVGNAEEKCWSITTTSMQELVGEELYVGALVVNKSGLFMLSDLFETLPTILNPVTLEFDYLSKLNDLEITFDENGYENYGRLSFDEIIQINAGSYNACALMVEESASYMIKTISNVKYVDTATGKTYVLVGDVLDNGTEKTFVNEVILNENVSSSNKTCKIYMLQFKNAYNKDIYDTINSSVLTNGKTFSSGEIVEFYNEANDAIIINGKYIINTNILDYGYYSAKSVGGGLYQVDSPITPENGAYSYYEESVGFVVLSAPNNNLMIEKIYGYYGVNKAFFISSYQSNLIFTNVTLSPTNALLVGFETDNCLSDPEKTINVKLEFEGEQIEVSLGNVKIISGSPETIILRHGVSGENDIELLSNKTSEADVLNNNKYLQVEVGYNHSQKIYTYSLKLVIGANSYPLEFVNIFNESTSSDSSALGFQDKVSGKLKTYSVKYSTSSESVFNIAKLKDYINGTQVVLVEKFGSTVVTVEIGSTSSFLKIVTTGDFTFTTTDDKTSFEKASTTDVELSEFVELSDANDVISPCKDNLVSISNLKSVEYGGNELLVATQDPSTKGWTLKKDPNDPDETPVLEIFDSAVGWMFKRDKSYLTLTISFNVETVLGTSSTIRITFKPSISIDVNDQWKGQTLYAGTTVQLSKIVDAGNKEYSSSSVFKITKNSEGDVSFRVEDGVSSISGSSDDITCEINEADIGKTITIVAVVEGNDRANFQFEVASNVVATKNNIVLQSENAYSLSDLYELSAYDTNQTYGADEKTLYSSVTYYTDASYNTTTSDETEYFKHTYLTGTPNNLSLLIENGSDNDPELTYDYQAQKLSIGEMSSLSNSAFRDITIQYTTKYGGEFEVSTDSFEIVNKYEIPKTDTEELDKLTFKAFKIYSIFANFQGSTDFELDDIEIDNLEVDIVSGGFYIKTPIDQVLEDVEIVLTFKHKTTGQKLTYEGKIKIIPYTPDVLEAREKAYSGSNYDLLDKVYDVEALKRDENIETLYVNAIRTEENQNSENVASKVISSGWVDNGGYNSSSADTPSYNVVLSEIDSPSKTVYIEYVITYKQDPTKSYVYYVELNIENRQSIAVQYPESDLKIDSIQVQINNKDEAFKIANVQTESDDKTYSLSNINYEGVAVYQDKETTINFVDEDLNKKVERVSVTNDGTDHNQSISRDVTISLVGYQSGNIMYNYIARGINYSTPNCVILPKAEKGMFGLLIFKLTSKSGYSVYYNIFVTCVTIDGISISNNLDVVLYNNEENTEYEEFKPSFVVDTDTTYLDVVEEINTATIQTGGASYYLNKFKKSYNADTEVYMYNGNYTGETDENSFNYNGKRWTKLTSSDKILLNEHFNIITLGLVIDDGLAKYCYGTITLYVQPINKVSPKTSGELETILNFDKSRIDGYYSADVMPSADAIISPFNGGWTATIVEVDGFAYDSSVHTNYQIDTGDSTKVNIARCVLVNTTIKVKYTWSSTIVFVTYTHLSTEVPSQEILDSKIVDVGNFSTETGFNNVVNLGTGDNCNEYYFGTYKGDYQVYIGENQVTSSTPIGNVSLSTDGKLTFEQGYEDYFVDIKIKYTDFVTGVIERTFKFKVLAGVYMPTTAGQGTSQQNPLLSTPIGRHDEMEGSQISVSYKPDTNFYSYTIGDTNIYTSVATKLELRFNNQYNYVVCATDTLLGESDYLTINGTDSNINFVHLPQATSVVMEVVVKNAAGDVFATKNIYLKLAQTYSTVEATYLVSGADHENVKDSSTLTLDSSWFNDRFKFWAYEKVTAPETAVEGVDYYEYSNGSYKKINVTAGSTVDTGYYKYILKSPSETKIGFTTSNHPNLIRYKCEANASISSSEISFNEVSSPTKCIIVLQYSYGNEVVANYIYQIMPDVVDGLDYTLDYELSESQKYGYFGSYKEDPYSTEVKYVSFMLADQGQVSESYQSERFVIGELLDTSNSNIFTNLEVKVDGVGVNSSNITKRVISDGSYTDSNLDVVGGYTNGVQYAVKKGDYTFYITLDNDNKFVEIIVSRPAGKEKVDKFVLTLSAGGVNGGSTLINGLELVLVNTLVIGNYEDISDTRLANTDVDLFSDNDDSDTYLNNGAFVENDGSASLVYQYKFAGGKYNFIGAAETEIDAESIRNMLFTYDESNKIIKLQAVGQDIHLNATFNAVYDSKYIMKVLTYLVDVKVNMTIVVNGEELEDNTENTTPTTKFILTNVVEGSTSRNFEITKEFVSKGDVEEKNKEVIEGETYYNVLAFDLYLGSQIRGRDQINVEIKSNTENKYVLTNDKDGIIFVKDFDGLIELVLSVNLGSCGTYSVTWNIEVTGILNLRQQKEQIGNTSNPISSGLQQDLIGVSEDSAVNMKPSNLFAGGVNTISSTETTTLTSGDSTYGYYTYDETKYIAEESGSKYDSSKTYYAGPMVHYKYVIHSISGNDTKTPQERFSSTTNVVGTSDEKVVPLGSGLIVSLPNVPITTETTSYYVTYMFYVEYLGLSYNVDITDDARQLVQMFYVTYSVINIQDIRVNVSEINVNTNVAPDADLTLFYYKEEATIDETDYTLSYDDVDVSGVYDVYLSDGTNSAKADDDSTDALKQFEIDGKTVKYYTASNELEVNGAKVSMTKTTVLGSSKDVCSVFESTFNNIYAYKEFISTYLNKESVRLTQNGETALTFKLIEVSNNGFGIKLNENGGTLFNNEMNAELSLVDEGVSTLTIGAYSSENTAGFKLFASNTISSKSSYKLSDLFLRDYVEIKSNKVTMETPIIGVGISPDTSWLDNAEDCETDTTDNNPVAIITIPKDTSNNIKYQVQKVTYTYTGNQVVGSYYTISQVYYYIYSSKVVVPNYAKGVGTDRFRLVYRPNDSGNIVLDMSEAINVWTTVDGYMKCSPSEDCSLKNEPTGLTFEDNTLSIPATTLMNYKLQNPTKTSYEDIYVEMNASDVDVCFIVEYILPQTIEYSVSYSTGTSDIIVGTEYTDLKSVSDEMEFVKLESNSLKLDGTKISEYFTSNTNSTSLTITCTATNNSDKTINFTVVVNKTASS